LSAITVAARKQPSAATRSGWSMRLCHGDVAASNAERDSPASESSVAKAVVTA
jgi:hypothetical protein